MPGKSYDGQIRVKTVRLGGHVGDYATEWAAIKVVSGRLGMSAETLRKWLRQSEVEAGEAAGVTSESARQIRKLKRKNAELEQTIEILKEAAGGEFGYTAFVIDAYAGLIPGWECSTSKRTSFVQAAIRQAIAYRRQQGHPIGEGAIHHSDADSQYTAIHFGQTLFLAGLTPSIGSVDDSLANALTETTIGLYKTECVREDSPISIWTIDHAGRLRRSYFGLGGLAQQPPAHAPPRCVFLDYDALCGIEPEEFGLFKFQRRCSSPFHEREIGRGVAGTKHLVRPDRLVQALELGDGQGDVGCGDVLLEVAELGGTDEGDDVVALRE
jgi:transposase InsO family protein